MGSRGESDVGVQHDATDYSRQIETLSERSPDSNRERLTSVVFDDILPRLHMLHHELSAKDAERAFTQREISDFSDTLIRDDGVAVEDFLQHMRERGHTEEALFLGLMAETARHLGGLWEEDHCTFIDVTIGVTRLQKLLCEFSSVREPAFSDGDHRVLLCALAGERHLFGLDMVACFMRHDSWDVELQKGLEPQDIAAAVAGSRFAILGLTLSAESGLESLCRAIRAARVASINPAMGVLVGGPLFLKHPKLVAQVGADAMASDAASASLLAKKFLLRQKKNYATHRQSSSRKEIISVTPHSAAQRRTDSADSGSLNF